MKMPQWLSDTFTFKAFSRSFHSKRVTFIKYICQKKVKQYIAVGTSSPVLPHYHVGIAKAITTNNERENISVANTQPLI